MKKSPWELLLIPLYLGLIGAALYGHCSASERQREVFRSRKQERRDLWKRSAN
jgi:hypothetical protein